MTFWGLLLSIDNLISQILTRAPTISLEKISDKFSSDPSLVAVFGPNVIYFAGMCAAQDGLDKLELDMLAKTARSIGEGLHSGLLAFQ